MHYFILTFVSAHMIVNGVVVVVVVFHSFLHTQALLTQVENFQYEASCILKEATCDLTKLTDLLEHGMSLDIELPELNDIKQVTIELAIDCLRSYVTHFAVT